MQSTDIFSPDHCSRNNECDLDARNDRMRNRAIAKTAQNNRRKVLGISQTNSSSTLQLNTAQQSMTITAATIGEHCRASDCLPALIGINGVIFPHNLQKFHIIIGFERQEGSRCSCCCLCSGSCC